MINDPIIEEIYRARQKILEECQGDLRVLMERLKTVENQYPHRVVSIEEFRKRTEQERTSR